MQATKGKNFNSSKISKFKSDDKSVVPAKNFNSPTSNNFKVKIKNIEKVRCHHCKTKGYCRKDCDYHNSYHKLIAWF